jgi:MATE family multidrug resistance protein
MTMEDSLRDPFLDEERKRHCKTSDVEDNEDWPLICSKDSGRGFLEESKKLWSIAGPAMFSRIAMYGMNVVTLAFAGHLGDLELAAISIASTVVVGLNFGLFLGMGSALETLCGQAYGAKEYHMLGVYMQRSWIVLFIVAILLLPIYIFATPILKLMGQPDDIAELSGSVSIWFIPQHFAFVFMFPIQKYLQSQLKNMVIAWLSAASLLLHIALSWLFIIKLEMGLVGAAITLDLAWWVPAIGQFLYVTCGGCPYTWTGLSKNAFRDLWPFFKLSIASGIMLCLENWYYRVLVLLTGKLPDPQVAVDSLSICMNINGWEMMIPLGFFVAAGVRIANELGAGNGRGAKFAIIVSVTTSSAIGVAVGSGWQSYVAWINIGCYYVIGVPFGVLLGWVFNLGVLGIWIGMICGTTLQTIILAYITYRCDWEQEATKALNRVNTWSSDNSTQIR